MQTCILQCFFLKFIINVSHSLSSYQMLPITWCRKLCHLWKTNPSQSKSSLSKMPIDLFSSNLAHNSVIGKEPSLPAWLPTRREILSDSIELENNFFSPPPSNCSSVSSFFSISSGHLSFSLSTYLSVFEAIGEVSPFFMIAQTG